MDDLALPLSGKRIVKISLKTGDEPTARERWGHVHIQVEGMRRAAVDRAK